VARLLEYDALRHRLWIAGQRCHHGATGSLVTAAACVGLIAGQARPVLRTPREPQAAGADLSRSLLALALAGGAMMAHDWKDHDMWFRRGSGER
jgi:hypothetical protein